MKKQLLDLLNSPQVEKRLARLALMDDDISSIATRTLEMVTMGLMFQRHARIVLKAWPKLRAGEVLTRKEYAALARLPSLLAYVWTSNRAHAQTRYVELREIVKRAEAKLDAKQGKPANADATFNPSMMMEAMLHKFGIDPQDPHAAARLAAAFQQATT